jgi:hypothetical protein
MGALIITMISVRDTMAGSRPEESMRSNTVERFMVRHGMILMVMKLLMSEDRIAN